MHIGPAGHGQVQDEALQRPALKKLIEAGKIVLWRDYWDLGTLMSGAPSWWIERLATFSQADFS